MIFAIGKTYTFLYVLPTISYFLVPVSVYLSKHFPAAFGKSSGSFSYSRNILSYFLLQSVDAGLPAKNDGSHFRSKKYCYGSLFQNDALISNYRKHLHLESISKKEEKKRVAKKSI